MDDYCYEHHTDHHMMTGNGSPVMYDANHTTPMLRSVGLIKCEYCGSSNVDRCTGVREVYDHLGEYQRRMFGHATATTTTTTTVAVEGTDNSPYHNNEDDYFRGYPPPNKNDTSTTQQSLHHNCNDTNSTTSSSSNNTSPPPCPRPKLFFLKKRPPFANTNIDTGWNVQTQHRQLLFEPPSSMEGVGRGYGEVRGQLGDYCTVNYTSPKMMMMMGGGGGGNGNRGGGGGCAKDLCGSDVCGETDISFRSSAPTTTTTANGGGERSRSPVVMMNNNNHHHHHDTNTNNNNNNNTDSDTGRSLSPLQWVNGSEIKGVMKWFA